MSFQQFGFGQDDSNIGNKGKRLKMDKGEIARISFLWWPGLDEGEPNLDAPTPGFVAGDRAFMKGVGYFINKGPEYTKIAGEPPKKRINTIIVKWPTTRTGKLDAQAIQDGAFEVMYWVFDPNKYDEIKPVHMDWPFGKHDLKINCSDAGFQKMSFSPYPDSVLRKFLEKGLDHPLVKQIIKSGQALLADVRNEIGKDMTIEQIREKLTGGGGGGAAPSQPVNDSVATDDIDDALGDLLDD